MFLIWIRFRLRRLVIGWHWQKIFVDWLLIKSTTQRYQPGIQTSCTGTHWILADSYVWITCWSQGISSGLTAIQGHSDTFNVLWSVLSVWVGPQASKRGVMWYTGYSLPHIPYRYAMHCYQWCYLLWKPVSLRFLTMI